MTIIRDHDILEKIKSEEFEQAKDLIDQLENTLFNEKAKYNIRILRERIEKLKRDYFLAITSKNGFSLRLDSFENTNKEIFKNLLSRDLALEKILDEKKEVIYSDKNCYKCINVNNKNLTIPNVNQSLFENCTFIKTNIFTSNEYVFLRYVFNSEFSFVTKQVRLFDCKDLKLSIFTETGVVLENCKNIEIRKLDIETNQFNKYKHVRDFTSPFSNENYKVID
ncbi:hypothetical protein GVAV_002599 [Gurleya vavrai]